MGSLSVLWEFEFGGVVFGFLCASDIISRRAGSHLTRQSLLTMILYDSGLDIQQKQATRHRG
jgi:hypothetical protein